MLEYNPLFDTIYELNDMTESDTETAAEWSALYDFHEVVKEWEHERGEYQRLLDLIDTGSFQRIPSSLRLSTQSLLEEHSANVNRLTDQLLEMSQSEVLETIIERAYERAQAMIAEGVPRKRTDEEHRQQTAPVSVLPVSPKDTPQNSHNRKNKQGEHAMKKLYAMIFVAIALLCCLAVYTGKSIRETEREKKVTYYTDGYDKGYNDGYDTGYDEGHWKGYEFGYDEGYWEAEKAYEDNYTDGYNEGYYAGGTYTCLYFGDVDRAFQCAQNGCAWDVFLEAYDQYIADIFSDDDTESDLFWALISATVSNDLTKEEKELLVSTFGEELFTRNGISLTVAN